MKTLPRPVGGRTSCENILQRTFAETLTNGLRDGRHPVHRRAVVPDDDRRADRSVVPAGRVHRQRHPPRVQQLRDADGTGGLLFDRLTDLGVHSVVHLDGGLCLRRRPRPLRLRRRLCREPKAARFAVDRHQSQLRGVRRGFRIVDCHYRHLRQNGTAGNEPVWLRPAAVVRLHCLGRYLRFDDPTQHDDDHLRAVHPAVDRQAVRRRGSSRH